MKNSFIVGVFIIIALIDNNAIQVSAILNGHQAPITPYHAYVRCFNVNNLGLEGGGTLVSRQHIITVAQLIFSFVRWDIGLGSNQLNQLQMFETTNTILHPSYTSVTRDHNIGIVILNNPVTISANVQPIALPPIGSMYPYEFEEGIITGFGITSAIGTRADRLQRAYKRVISNARCTAFISIVTPNHFCAEDTEIRSNICNGDIGGSFTVLVQRQEFLVGMSSINVEACNNQSPSGYLRISHYRQWIQETIQV